MTPCSHLDSVKCHNCDGSPKFIFPGLDMIAKDPLFDQTQETIRAILSTLKEGEQLYCSYSGGTLFYRIMGKGRDLVSIRAVDEPIEEINDCNHVVGHYLDIEDSDVVEVTQRVFISLYRNEEKNDLQEEDAPCHILYTEDDTWKGNKKYRNCPDCGQPIDWDEITRRINK